MPAEVTPLWKQSLKRIPCRVQALRLPERHERELSQDQEWCEVVIGGQARRLRFHDYSDIYGIPGLYERLFYERLKCTSPGRVCGLLADVLQDWPEEPEDLRVLDLGAGNGMVGEELKELGADYVVGADIIPEAKQAALRDRPGTYGQYYVSDFTDLPEQDEERLRARSLNCLSTVAALGFGDIPPRAFLKALDLIATPGWIAFNIKEDFLSEKDSTGFCKLIRSLSRREVIQIQAYRRYRHRFHSDGRPLHYVAMIARKLKDVPDAQMAV